MQKILFTACLLIVLFSCVAPQPPNIPMQSHADVMTQDFPTKKSVFMKFGTPTSKETVENIENWYFKLSEVTASTSIGHSYGTGRISQNPMNPYFRTVDRELVTRQSQNTFQKTNSTTVETFVKFWFVNDTVVKWESYGPRLRTKYQRHQTWWFQITQLSFSITRKKVACLFTRTIQF